MSQAARFTVSIEPELLARFDTWIHDQGFANRSQGVRRLFRERLAEDAWEAGDGEAWTTITYLYDHHKRELLEELTHLQHSHLAEVISTLHVHVDHQHCLEVCVLRGPVQEVRRIANAILGTKGILSGSVSPIVNADQLADRKHRHDGPTRKPHSHSD